MLLALSFALLAFYKFGSWTDIIGIYFFIRASMAGYKAWRLLKVNETDDHALLEGTERLSNMFRWLSLWGGFYVISLVAEAVWKTL